MIINFITLIIISIASSLIFVISPLSLGIWVLLLCLILSRFLSITLSSWYAILLFLIYIGGLLVIFSYFVALQPNQQLGFLKLIVISTITLLYINTIFLLVPGPLIVIHSLLPNRALVLINYNLSIILILGIFLFFALIVVVKITYITKQPLRPFIYVFSYTKITPSSKNY